MNLSPHLTDPALLQCDQVSIEQQQITLWSYHLPHGRLADLRLDLLPHPQLVQPKFG